MESKRLVMAAATALMVAGCGQKTLPTGPSTLSRGLIIFEHANYLGQSALIEESVKDLRDYKGPCVESTSSGTNPPVYTETHSWKNCVSSIRIAEGWKATLYTNTGFGGDSFSVSGDLPNLQLVSGKCDHGGFNDCVESIRVVPQ